jgi:hypothetical protein
MKLRQVGAAGGLILTLLGAGTAWAAGSFAAYNVITPKLGGQVIAVQQTKVTALEKAILCSRSIGGGYTQQVQIRSADTNTAYSPWISFAQGQRKEISYFEAGNGRQFRLWIGSNYSTTVDVQSQGNGSVDNPGTCP